MIWRHIANWLGTGAPCCLVTVREARGSTPREAGAQMAIGLDNSYTGTIGGGALEWEAMAVARDLITRHPEGLGTERTFALGPALAQCCGGSVILRFEVFAPGDLDWIAALARAEEAGSFTTEGEPDARRVVIRRLALSAAAFVAEQETHGTAKRDVLLFGAGHVGRALVLALAPLPFTVHWIDNRQDVFPSSLPRNTIILPAVDSKSIASEYSSGEIAVVATHSHTLDLEIVADLLKNKSFHFIGLIGSKTKRNRFLSRLLEMGFDKNATARLTCPIGIPGVHGKEPAVIAASVAAQLLMLPRAISVPD